MEKKFRPNVTIPQFSRAITHDPRNDHLGHQWAKKRWLKFTPGNPRLISRQYAVKILSAWRRTLNRAEFAAATDTTVDWLRHQIDKRKIKTVYVMVFRRIPKSEIPKARSLWGKAQKDVVFPEKSGFGRYSPEKLAGLQELAKKARAQGKGRGPITRAERQASSRRLKRLHKESCIPYMNSEQARELVRIREERKELTTDSPLYQGRNRRERQEIGTRRLVTIKRATTILGKSQADVESMVMSGTLRHFRVGERVLVYFSQIEALKQIVANEGVLYQTGKRQKDAFVPRL